MARIALFGATGMLGSAIYNVLKEKNELILITRDPKKLDILDKAYGDVKNFTSVSFDLDLVYQEYLTSFPKQHIIPSIQSLVKSIGEVDGVVNAVGVIKPYSTINPAVTLFINGAFPHLLAAQYGSKLIQITTDCAFSGIEGAPYTEESPKSPNDLYGLSKSIGEPIDQSLVLRTSIIGPEIHGFVSLISWFKQQEGKTIKGFTNHFWNGITTRQFGKICNEIISNRGHYPKTGLYHIFSNDVSKFDMVQAFKEKYGTQVTIEAAAPDPVDRRLGTVKELCKKLNIPTFIEMLKEI